MITAGINEKTGGATDRNDPAGRLRLLDTNVEVMKDIIGRLHATAPQAMVLGVTDPPNPLADAVRMLGHDRHSTGHISTAGGYRATVSRAPRSAHHQ